MSLCYLIPLFGLLSIIVGILAMALFVCILVLVRFYNYKCGPRIKPDARKVIMVTGSTSGIGLALARHLHRIGFTVIATYNVSKNVGYDELKSLSESRDETIEEPIGRKPAARMFLIQLDVQSLHSIRRARQEVEGLIQRHNLQFYCLINNAGLSTDGPAEWTSYESINDVIGINVLGVALMSRMFATMIIKSKGKFINCGSGLHMIPFGAWPNYTSSKSALTRYSESFDIQLRPYGAACCVAITGFCMTDTSLVFRKAKELERSKASMTPEELTMYANSIKECELACDKIIEKAYAKNPRLIQEKAREHGVKLPESVREFKPPKVRTLREKFSDTLARLTSGGSVYCNYEELLGTFEYAITSRDPYTQVFPGNLLYTHFFGPWMNYLPPELFRHIGAAVFKRIIS